MSDEQRWPEPVYLTKDHAINMTLRDAFAISALQGFLTRETKFNPDLMMYAGAAYDVADAMMKARGQ